MQLSALHIKQQQEWKEDGRLEEKQEVAIALLKKGLPPELIAKATGLSLDAIHQLQP
jgi:predicted transposase/invertase (TIGR01784 family)